MNTGPEEYHYSLGTKQSYYPIVLQCMQSPFHKTQTTQLGHAALDVENSRLTRRC